MALLTSDEAPAMSSNPHIPVQTRPGVCFHGDFTPNLDNQCYPSRDKLFQSHSRIRDSGRLKGDFIKYALFHVSNNLKRRGMISKVCWVW